MRGLVKGYKFKPGMYASRAEKRRGVKLSDSTRNAISVALKGRNIGFSQPNLSEEHKNKISKTLLKTASRGKAHYHWKEDRTSYEKVRSSGVYRQWRKSVLIRDSYKCVVCSSDDVQLQVDHIKSFIDYPELRLDIDNGRTLCLPCHRETDNYGFKIHNSRERKVRIHEEDKHSPRD